jgi:hypothetical protein
MSEGEWPTEIDSDKSDRTKGITRRVKKDLWNDKTGSISNERNKGQNIN